MKGEILMMNFKQAKENTMNGIAKKSTLITFVLATIGVAATAYLASKEIPKAKAEVKEILAKEDLTKKQKATETVKVVAKTTWKTGAVAIATILLVTGTAAITAANTATTVAGLTNIANMYEQKLKDTNAAIEELPQKTQEEVKRNVSQKVVNRATSNVSDDILAPNEMCPDKYVWVDTWTGAKFRATFQQLETAAELINLRVSLDSYQTIFDFYEELVKQGAEFIGEAYPQLVSDFAWTHSIGLDKSAYINDKGYTIHTIEYNEPTMDF